MLLEWRIVERGTPSEGLQWLWRSLLECRRDGEWPAQEERHDAE